MSFMTRETYESVSQLLTEGLILPADCGEGRLQYGRD